jgi:hypothetical protein
VVKFEEPEPGTVVRDEVDITWEADDPDEDDLTYEVFYAAAGTDEWTKVEPAADEDADADSSADDATTDDGLTDDGTTDESMTDEGDTPADDTPADEAPGAEVRRLGPGRALPIPVAFRHLAAPPAAPAEPGATRRGGARTEPAEEPAGDEATDESAEPDASDEDAEALTESSLTWDTKAVPDGLYVLKVVATDAKRNPDDPRRTEVKSKTIRVDNTAPYALEPATDAVAPLPAELKFGEDGTYLSSAEYRFDDGEWQALLPADGIFDQRFETLKTPTAPTEAGEHTLSVRVRDAAGNVAKHQWRFEVAGAPAP